MRHAVSLASTFKYLVQLLVPNLDRATLAALILKEAKEGSSQNSEHDNVAYPLISIGVVLTFSPPTRKETMPPARSTRPLKKLMKSSTISVANFVANEAVFWTRWPAVVKKDQTSSTSEAARSDRALIIEDMVILCGLWNEVQFKLRM
jgi:hypothetical protein